MRSSLLILFLLVCGSPFAREGDLNLCRWHVSDIIQSSDYHIIRKTKLYCFLSNDNDNLYINMKVEDQGILNMILKEGLIIWISLDGREVKKMGVRFPTGSQNQVAPFKSTLSENETNQQRNTVTPISLSNTIELIGFINEQERRFSSENHDNFRGSVKFEESGILLYTLIMPIAKLPLRNSREGHGTMPFMLGIEYGFLPATNQSGGNRGPAPSSVFHSRPTGSGASEIHWITDIRLATSK
jgi:hypothetical protein